MLDSPENVPIGLAERSIYITESTIGFMLCDFGFNASGVIYLLRNNRHGLCQAISGGNPNKDWTFS